MRSAFMVLVFSIAVAVRGGADSSPATRVLNDPCTRAAFAQLLRGAHGNVEVAAFIVEENGRLTFLIWPRMAWFRSQTWSGEIPRDTVAIVHTHPPRSERPSPEDVLEAARLHLPFFVITASSIWVVEAGAESQVASVAEGQWTRVVSNHLPDGCNRPRLAR